MACPVNPSQNHGCDWRIRIYRCVSDNATVISWFKSIRFWLRMKWLFFWKSIDIHLYNASLFLVYVYFSVFDFRYFSIFALSVVGQVAENINHSSKNKSQGAENLLEKENRKLLKREMDIFFLSVIVADLVLLNKRMCMAIFVTLPPRPHIICRMS